MADLKIKIKGDASSLNREMNKSQSKMQKFGSAAKAAFIGVAGGLAVAAGAARAFFSVINPIADKLDDIGKASKRIGISTEDFQKLAFAARRTGVETSTVEKSFKRMQKTISDAGDGLSTAMRALDKLGLSFDQIKDKSPVEQFELIATRLAGMENVTLRNAAAQDLFGRAGLAIAPLIKEYAELSAHLEDINGIMSEKNVKAAEDYKDALEDLSTAFDAFIGSTGDIALLAAAFERLESALTGIRKGVPSLEQVKGIGMRLFIDAKNANPFEIASGIGREIALAGQEEQAARIVNKEIRDRKRKQGAKAKAGVIDEITEPGKTTAASMVQNSLLGGGGTLASLGGDISGGGFSARMNVQQEQLTTLKDIKEIAGQLRDSMPGMTDGQLESFVDDYKDIFKN